MDLHNLKTSEKVVGSASPDTSVAISSKSTVLDINRETLRIKLHYFLFIGALGAALPFVTIYAKNKIGISATSLGVMLTVQQFIFVVTKPVIGYLVDFFNKLKLVIICLIFGQGIFLFLILPIHKINFDQAEKEEIFNGSHYEIAYYEQNVCKLCEKCEDFQNTADTFPTAQRYLCSETLCFSKIISDYTSENIEKWCNGSKYGINGSHQMQNVYSSASCIMCFQHVKNEMTSRTSLKNTTGTKFYDASRQSDFATYQFWVFSLVYLISSTCTNSLFTLSDTACCESVQRTGGDFGRIRLWGSIGWAVMAPIGGYLNDYTNGYLASWCVMAIMSILSVWNFSKLHLVKQEFSQNVLKDVRTVLRSKEFLAFNLGVLMNGIGIGIIWFYLIWFLSTIGGSRFLIGLAETMQSFVGNIPFMFFSGWMIKNIGPFPLLSLSLLGYSARFLWYSFLYNPWYVLPIEVLNGLTVGVLYANVALYGKNSAKPGTEATTQSILFTTLEGFGAGLGCILAGVGFDQLGPHKTFFIAGMCAACGMLINLFLTMLIQRRKGVLKITTKDNA